MARPRIIIADDEAYIRTVLSLKLTQAGYDVQQAPDGKEALRLATEQPPALVITDYQMPAMDGYQMTVALFNAPHTRNVPVLMLTARGHRLSPSDLAATNIKFLFAKPFSIREIIGKVNEVLATPGIASAA